MAVTWTPHRSKQSRKTHRLLIPFSILTTCWRLHAGSDGLFLRCRLVVGAANCQSNDQTPVPETRRRNSKDSRVLFKVQQLGGAPEVRDCTGVWARTPALCDVHHKEMPSYIWSQQISAQSRPVGSTKTPCWVQVYLSPPVSSCCPSLLTCSFLLNFRPTPLHILHSLYLCLLALCVCIDFVAVHAPCFSLFFFFDVGSEMDSQAAKWNQSPFSLTSLFSPQQAQTPSALNWCVWNELSVLWLSTHLFSPPASFSAPPSVCPPQRLFLFDSFHLCGCQKWASFTWFNTDVCLFSPPALNLLLLTFHCTNIASDRLMSGTKDVSHCQTVRHYIHPSSFLLIWVIVSAAAQ